MSASWNRTAARLSFDRWGRLRGSATAGNDQRPRFPFPPFLLHQNNDHQPQPNTLDSATPSILQPLTAFLHFRVTLLDPLKVRSGVVAGQQQLEENVKSKRCRESTVHQDGPTGSTELLVLLPSQSESPLQVVVQWQQGKRWDKHLDGALFLRHRCGSEGMTVAVLGLQAIHEPLGVSVVSHRMLHVLR